MPRLRLLFLLPILCLAGCGGGNPAAPANISGSVKYKGQPVTAGSVVFYSKADAAAGTSCGIDKDGNFAVSDIPAGELVVVVETESANPEHKKSGTTAKDADRYKKEQGKSMQPPPGGRGGGGGGGSDGGSDSGGKYVKIPEKYTKPKSSPLTFTAKAGRNVYNIELE